MEEDKNPAAPSASADEAPKLPVDANDDIPDKDMPPPPVLDDDLPPKPPKLKKSPKGLVIVLVVFLVLAVAGAAGWFFLLRDTAEPTAQTQQPAADTPAVTDDVPDATNSETFTSSPYRITFQYPKTWKVTEANNNNILIQSESFTYKTATGESKNGNFRVFVSKPVNSEDSVIIGKGVAIQASTKLVYEKPTPAQRTETNLSLFGLDNENNFAFLLITGNFTLQKGDTLGPNFGKEIETIIIGGGFSEPGKEPGMATNPVPVDGFQNTNAYKQALAIIQSFEIM